MRACVLAAIVLLHACGGRRATYQEPTVPAPDPGAAAPPITDPSQPYVPAQGYPPAPVTTGYHDTGRLFLSFGTHAGGHAVLVTPWGPVETIMQQDTGGSFSFANRIPESFDLFGPAAATLFASPWELRVDAATYGWVPASLEGGAVIEAVVGYHLGIDATTVRQGPSPNIQNIQLRAEPGGILQPGRPTRFVLAMRNDGPGPASRVRAVTKSPEISLHGIGFSFGLIGGSGGSKERQLTVMIPPNLNAAEVTVVVVVEEARGFVPAPAAFRFAVANDPLSCTGKITRAEFDAKMAKLKALLDDGTLKPDDYRRYEAVNLACLE